MRPLTLPRLAAGLLAATACGLVGASQFFVFPVEHVEGFGADSKASRARIDPAMRAMLVDDDATREDLHVRLRETLRQQLQSAYPGSVVNAAQVSTTRAGGSPAYLAEVSCGQGFRAPLGQSYAVVVGVSRASRYRIARIGGVVEVLVPVTLNLQLLKADAGKIVYSLSHTQYQSFSFDRAEFDTPAAQRKIVDQLKLSMQDQVAALVAELKASFQPKDTVARVLGAEQGVFVIDKGYESGLKEGEQIEVVHKGSGREIGVNVLSTASGYSVIRPVDASLKTGDELVVTAGAAADDSRKPRVLPVVGGAEGQDWTPGVAEFFSKQLGFRAPFQILPANVDFGATLDRVNASLRCLDEGAKKAMKKTSGERTEQPHFFLRFERSRSPIFHLEGLGKVETRDTFVTSLSAQLVNEQGDVVFSALASDTYQLDRVARQGVAIEQAEEISLKNATEALTQQVIDKARLEPAAFKIGKVEGSTIRVPGLALPEGEAATFEVLRPLGLKVGSRNAVRRLAIESAGAAASSDGTGTTLSFVTTQGAAADDQPRPGDELRVLNLPLAGQGRYSECRSPYQASNGSVAADHLLPLIRHASYGSSLFKANVATPEFVDDANALLRTNYFSTVLKPFPVTETCLRAAYLVRQEPLRCDTAASCAEDVKVAPAVLLVRGGTRVATYTQSDALHLEGFAESEAAHFVGLKAHEHILKTLPSFTTSLNVKK